MQMFGIKIEAMEPVAIFTETHMETVRRKPYEATRYRLRGRARYTDPDGRMRVATAATFDDCGPLGVSKVYTVAPDVEPTEEEREEGRERIREIITQIMVDQGIW